jgi:hypothetical protein
MKNNYKQHQRQIEKSRRNDWNQELDYLSFREAEDKRKLKRERKPIWVYKDGKLVREFNVFRNGLPMVW